jgi:hypothetical protein
MVAEVTVVINVGICLVDADEESYCWLKVLKVLGRMCSVSTL